MEYYPPGQVTRSPSKVTVPFYEQASKVRMQSVLDKDDHQSPQNPRVQMVARRWESFFRQQETEAHGNKPKSLQPLSLDTEAAVTATTSPTAYLQQLKELLSRTVDCCYSSASSTSSSPATARKRLSSVGPNALLKKLKEDLNMAASSFRMDFIQQNGITMLCAALKKLQDEISIWENSTEGDDLEILKNKMVDEFHCIMCIKFAAKDLDGCDEVLLASSGNLETVCQSLLSPCMQSRIAVMDFLSNLLRACPKDALRPILQQFTTLRVRYAQPDRFRFLVGMTQSSGKLSLLFKASLLSMTNEMLTACPSGNYQVFLQTELEEAGLRIDDVEKAASALAARADAVEDAGNVVRQIKVWRENYILVDKPRRNFAYKMKSTSSETSSGSSLPTYEYGSEYASSVSSPSPSQLSFPPAPILPARNSSASGEIRVIIKSISPSDDGSHFQAAGASIHPAPMPTTQPPQLNHSSHPQRHLFTPELPPPPSSLLSSPPFGRDGRPIQNPGLNQRMAEKFSGEYDNWRRKRSGDSVESGESSDSADSPSGYKAAVYLVDGISPAQRTMIDDVLLQFDRAYDVLDDGGGSVEDFQPEKRHHYF